MPPLSKQIFHHKKQIFQFNYSPKANRFIGLALSIDMVYWLRWGLSRAILASMPLAQQSVLLDSSSCQGDAEHTDYDRQP
jgi:hypothetical protein